MTTPTLTSRITTLEARIDTLIALAQGAPSTPVDAPAPKAPKAPAKKAKKAKAKPRVKCALHTAKQCNRKFWSTKGANEHVAKRTSWTANADNAPTSQGVSVLPEVGRSDSEHIRALFPQWHVSHGNVRVTSGYVDPASISDPYLANL